MACNKESAETSRRSSNYCLLSLLKKVSTFLRLKLRTSRALRINKLEYAHWYSLRFGSSLKRQKEFPKTVSELKTLNKGMASPPLHTNISPWKAHLNMYRKMCKPWSVWPGLALQSVKTSVWLNHLHYWISIALKMQKWQ